MEELVKELVAAAHRFRNTAIVDNDFPEMLERFDLALTRMDRALKCGVAASSPANQVDSLEYVRAVSADNPIEALPWLRPGLIDWSIVGMNHFRLEGRPEDYLYVAMTNEGRCITAQGSNQVAVWDELERQTTAGGAGDQWKAGWNAAKAEHETAIPCSRNYVGSGQEAADFRNGMTAYRDEKGLPDNEFDLVNEDKIPATVTSESALRNAVAVSNALAECENEHRSIAAQERALNIICGTDNVRWLNVQDFPPPDLRLVLLHGPMGKYGIGYFNKGEQMEHYSVADWSAAYWATLPFGPNKFTHNFIDKETGTAKPVDSSADLNPSKSKYKS